MFPITRLKDYLEQEKAPYHHQTHRAAYTSQEVAAEEHIPGKMVAKSVVIRIDNTFALAVLPAQARVDVSALKVSLRARDLRLATEFEFTGLFTDCEVGAMPPFGNLYGLPVTASRTLARLQEPPRARPSGLEQTHSAFSRPGAPLSSPQALNRLCES